MQEEQTAILDNNSESFEELLNQSLVSIYSGDIVEGTVIDVTPTEVIVDLGFKSDGIIPLSELSLDGTKEPDEIAQIGDKITAFVTRVRDGEEARVELSLRKLETKENYNKIKEAVGTNTVIRGTVTAATSSGLIVKSGDTKIFVPASQVPGSKDDDLSIFLKKEVSLTIIEVDEKRRRIVGSIKQATTEAEKKVSDEFWKDIFVGKEIRGTVKNFTSFGAFVDLGGVDGLIHLSELSWEKNKIPEDVFNIGDEVDVYIKDFDAEKVKISLGYKKATDNPWNKYAGQLAEGDVVTAKIVRIAPFGAFAELFPGVDGLIHISELDIGRVGSVQSKVKPGDTVTVKVIKIDKTVGKISLSMAALMDGYNQPTSDGEPQIIPSDATVEVQPQTIEETELKAEDETAIPSEETSPRIESATDEESANK